jgi:hypothetical protein
VLSITRSVLAQMVSINSGTAILRWNTTVWSLTISTPCSAFLATSSMVSALPTPIMVRQMLASLCIDSGWVMRKTAWRTSLG